MHVRMEPDHVSGSEPEEEDWGGVDEFRRGVICYNCGMMGHIETDCRSKGKSKGKGADGREEQDNKGSGKSGVQGRTFGKLKSWRYQGQRDGSLLGRAGKWGACGWAVVK